MVVVVVGKLSAEGELHLAEDYRLHMATQSCSKLILRESSSNPGYL